MTHPRILILTAYYYPFIGGVETHARELANYLFQKGLRIMIVTKRVDHLTPVRDRIDGIPVYRVPPSGERTFLNKWFMIPFAIFTILRLRRKFDIIYCPGYRGIGIGAILAGKILRRPVVLKSGNIGILSCRNWNPFLVKLNISPRSRLAELIKWPVSKIYTSAGTLACISHEIINEAYKCGMPASKAHYLPEGVDTKKFRRAHSEEKNQIRAKEGWSDNCIICMSVGRLSTEKGILDLVKAWRLIDNEKAILIVVGPDMPGHNMDAGWEVRKFVAEHGMNKNVIFYGSSDEIPQLLRSADIFVQPSHYEAFGLSVIEAMATAIPVVATRVGGMNDYLVDGENALMCEPKCPSELARQIQRLIDSADLRNMLGKNARNTVVRDFSESKIFGGFVRLFNEIISSCRN